MVKSGLLVRSVSWRCHASRVSQGKEAEHGAYSILRRDPTRIRLRLHQSDLPDLRPARLRLVLVAPPPLCDRTDPVQRLGPPRPPQLLPPLLQPCRLVARRLVALLGPPTRTDLGPDRPDRVGHRRYLVPQARPDGLRHRHAPRPAHLQPGLEVGQLGTRLGRPMSGAALPVVGPDQGLVPARAVPPVQEPAGPDQGTQGPEDAPRPQPPHTAPPGHGADPPAG